MKLLSPKVFKAANTNILEGGTPLHVLSDISTLTFNKIRYLEFTVIQLAARIAAVFKVFV